MQEGLLIKIKAIYGEIKGYLEGLPKEGSGASSGPWVVPGAIAKKFNNAIDELITITSTNYSRFKINDEGRPTLNIREVKPTMHAAVCRLEEEFSFEQKQ